MNFTYIYLSNLFSKKKITGTMRAFPQNVDDWIYVFKSIYRREVELPAAECVVFYVVVSV